MPDVKIREIRYTIHDRHPRPYSHLNPMWCKCDITCSIDLVSSQIQTLVRYNFYLHKRHDFFPGNHTVYSKSIHSPKIVDKYFTLHLSSNPPYSQPHPSPLSADDPFSLLSELKQ